MPSGIERAVTIAETIPGNFGGGLKRALEGGVEDVERFVGVDTTEDKDLAPRADGSGGASQGIGNLDDKIDPGRTVTGVANGAKGSQVDFPVEGLSVCPVLFLN